MASDALIRAVRAVLSERGPTNKALASLRAALVSTDEAMVEAVAARWETVAGRPSSKMERLMLEAMARDAIAALRDHITGEGA
jgi:hypothetical protein